VLPSGQNLTLGLLVTITLEAVPVCAYAEFSAILSVSKCVLEAMFCESVEHLRFCLDRLKCQYSGLLGLASVKETEKWLGWGRQSFCFW
jgi:hypothetical protein